MPSPEQPLLRVDAFEVLFGGRQVGFADVGRISSETDLEGEPRGRAHRMATIVLRRALTTATDLFDWRRAIVAGKNDRRNVTIRQLSAPGGKVVNAWRLVGAWPCRWSGPEFNANRSDVAVEELELAFDDVVWLDRRTPDDGG